MSETASPPPRFALRAVPLLVTGLMMAVVTLGAGAAAELTIRRLHLPSPQDSLLTQLYIQHGYQLVLALILIAVLKYRFVPADYGLHAPRGKSYILPAILWGVGFATAVSALAWWLESALHLGGNSGFAITRQNVWGWAVFEGLYVGPTEEIPFRALLVTYLAATMPGQLRLGRFAMNGAGIAVALLFALAHIQTFWTAGWQAALFQQVYAFAWGVLYAYWLEKSKSIVAPVIAHNLGDGITVAFWALGVFQG
ncbi:MAG TPA: CPBP family intramembrane glutamic endopeptidase [Rhizomicrobium sp.]|jgi:hypothetical protein|nr:CPBP family intramembrane glutamic endopeptidase [Rhizomicrobium sp.]